MGNRHSVEEKNIRSIQENNTLKDGNAATVASVDSSSKISQKHQHISQTSKNDNTSSGGCPMKRTQEASNDAKSKNYRNPKQYNVYGQEIDPSNNMPAIAAQEKSLFQETDLSTHREPSTIPKGGTDGTWTYPSPQMFWNALARKGKIDDTEEEDMEIVVTVHNAMNEKTWQKVLQWEEIDNETGEQQNTEPKLLKFEGRPNDTSPKAWIRFILGYSKPFDRHDWIVDRGGKLRRYVIDYYHADVDNSINTDIRNEGKTLTSNSLDTLKRVGSKDLELDNIIVDVRPAIDSIDSFLFRYVKMPAFRKFAMSSYVPLPLLLPPAFKRTHERLQLKNDNFSEKSESELRTQIHEAKDKCTEQFMALKSCEGSECVKLNMAFTYCMSSVVCPYETKEFDSELNKDNGNLDAAFKRMEACLSAVAKKTNTSNFK